MATHNDRTGRPVRRAAIAASRAASTKREATRANMVIKRDAARIARVLKRDAARQTGVNDPAKSALATLTANSPEVDAGEWEVLLTGAEESGAESPKVVGVVRKDLSDHHITLLFFDPSADALPDLEIGPMTRAAAVAVVGNPDQRPGIGGLTKIKRTVEEDPTHLTGAQEEERLSQRKEELKARFRERGAELPSGL